MISQTQQPTTSKPKTIHYPDSDGQPMADNTLQFRWIVIIKENLDLIFADDPEVFVAGDLLWYPVEGDNRLRRAPDAMVVFGRPKGDRGSYKQWEEDNIPPQVVFEILSPGNTVKEMAQKQRFYDKFGVEEYYIYDPDHNDLGGLQRGEQSLEVIEQISDWVSPRLGIRFDWTEEGLTLYRPDGSRFQTLQEIKAERDVAQAERDAAQAKADRLAQRLRELGVNPDNL
ncbi:Uma2 family endonuclease [Phormidium yuhuli AB48]|uniref:Uma2 family endonuclease n=1 Tax=Phormidium yuhuli AB48 TaxID=2940671 RepID=A0ABY5ATK2_9CYAN|nr:Uma2 family endonuclease [Phormidium yuhuli]USR91569.1 Uma2 family endonuclease [Phormidium yuhuli AB48]